MKKLARQPVHVAYIPVLREGLCVHVVRREMIAARNQHPIQVAILTRHAMQAFHAAHHRDERHQVVVAVHQ